MSMRLLAIFIVGLGGCGSAPAVKTPRIAAEPMTFPADDLTTFLNGYILEVPKAGRFLWNGQDIGAETLRAYLKQDGGRGRIVVQFEPGTPKTRVVWVRQQVIAASYCKLSRCAEAPWKAVRPVVN
jgi:hypothetical protein